MPKVLDIAIATLAVAMAIFQLLITQYLFLGVYQFLNVHLGFALVLVFLSLIRAAQKRGARLLLLSFLLLSLVAVTYVQLFTHDLVIRLGYPKDLDLIIGIIILIVVFEATRRCFGYIFPVLAVIFTLYTFFGYMLPRPLQAPYLSWESIVSRLSLLQGVYGLSLSVSANYIFLFVLFGSLFQVTAAPQFFMNLSRLVGRRLRGGAAMSAVISSAGIGMVTGAPLANVATTGAFTIPLMKKAGYRPEQAGAIEAAASTGGQIMPPVLGVAAFLMADITGISYIKIVAASAIPAMLYFLSAGAYVQLQAMKLDIALMTERADIRELLLSAPLFLGPLGLLTALLLIGFSVKFSIFWAIICLIIVSSVRKKTRPSLGEWVKASTDGAILGARIAVSCGLLGLIISPIALTGLGIKLPVAITSIGGGNLAIVLPLTMVICLILGLGLPTPVAYVLVAMTAAPALVRIGIPVLPAHFFVLYFASLSFVTPPVALSAFVASEIAGARYLTTAVESSKVTIGGFLVPYLLVSFPILLLEPQEAFSAAIALVSSVLVIFLLQVSICGQYLRPLNLPERMLVAVPIPLLLFYGITESHVLFAAGVAFFLVTAIVQWMKHLRASRDTSEV